MFIFLFLTGFHWASAAKILLLPGDHAGVVNFFTVAGNALKSRDHEVVMLTQQRYQHIVEKSNIHYILNKGKTQCPADVPNFEKNFVFNTGLSQLLSVIKFVKEATQVQLEICKEIMKSEPMMASLEKHKFDIALVDGFFCAQCLYVIPYKLRIPYITIMQTHEPWRSGLPAMPSVEGYYGLNIMKTDSSYLSILQNIGSFILSLLLPPSAAVDSQIVELAPEKLATTYDKLFRDSAVFLINADNTCMDYPRIEAPHYHVIGALAASSAKPLSEDFKQFVSQATHGLIVVSFGSIIKHTPTDLIKKMLESFRKIQQFVIMRHEGQIDDIPPNVMLVKWLPQNDLLGHPKTRLFVAHGGNNGQLEALYHGVPMVVMPFVGDMMYSASRTVDKKFGVTLNPMDFTSEDFSAALQEVLHNPIYTENIKKCSAISKDFPGAHEQVDFWVNHVLKFGGSGDHLKPISLDMPLYQMLMLDVVLFTLIIAVVLCCVLLLCCRWTIRICRPSKIQKSNSKTD